MLDQISKYRSPIMGGSILAILLYHTYWMPGIAFLDYTFSMLFGAVEFFLFLSGFGIYGSLKRNPNRLAFYKRRAIKILPAYIPFLIIWLVVNGSDLPLLELPGFVFGNLTGLSYWFQKSPYFNWYILSLPAFYLAAPLSVDLLDREKKHEIALLFLLPLLCCACCIGINRMMLFFARIPSFLLGLLFGKAFLEHREPTRNAKISMLIIGVVFYLIQYFVIHHFRDDTLWKYGLWFYWRIFTVPALLLLYCAMLRTAERVPILKLLVKLLGIIGGCTLEIYVVHIVVYEFVPTGTGIALWSLIALGIVVFSIFYHKLLQNIERHYL